MNNLLMIDLICYCVETICAIVFMLIFFLHGYKRADKSSSWFYYLLTGFFACVALSDAYYALSWSMGDYPYVFSPGDLSWVGGILFLITAALGIMDGQEKEKRRKYMIPASSAPVICLAFTAIYIGIYPDIIINYLLYGIPMAILAYLMLLLLLSEGVRGKRHRFYMAVLIWIAVQLFYDLFYSLGWDYGFAVPAVISAWVMFLVLIGIFFAARKGGTE